MKTIQIFYWACHIYKDCKYEHKQEFDYNIYKRNELISYFLDKGYNIMLLQSIDVEDKTLTIAVDTKRFTQR